MSKQVLQPWSQQTGTSVEESQEGMGVASATSGELVQKKRYARARLVSANDIAAELARVYRAMKSGELDPNVGTKLTYVLSTLSKIRMDSEIEERLIALEERNY